MKGINEGKKERTKEVMFDRLCSDVPKCIVVRDLLVWDFCVGGMR